MLNLNNKQRPFLKWAGGKFKLVELILEQLPKEKRTQLVEPFVGAGSVFLNSNFEHYLLSDINPDLINLYNLLKHQPDALINEAQSLFTEENRQSESYYNIRQSFNDSQNELLRAASFIYLNKHGFNGLCRYNKKGKFNVPMGSQVKITFPLEALRIFSEKAQKATFICGDYKQAFTMASDDSVIYCDPPYAPQENKKANANEQFTSYATEGFTMQQQEELAEMARETAQTKKIPVLISNHDTKFTRRIYKGARFKTFQVRRFISRDGDSRTAVDELLALFLPN